MVLKVSISAFSVPLSFCVHDLLNYMINLHFYASLLYI
jgi:hypothetical protein